jgi:hypothetical protein
MRNILLPFILCLLILIPSESKAQSSIEDSVITSIISQVHVDSVRSVIQSLQNFQTRYLRAPNRFEIAEWLKQRFLSYGFTDVVLDSFMCTNNYGGTTTTLQMNVVATLPGTDYPDQIYILGAHYDSFSSGNPMINAPGADDNASGTAAVLETARVVMASGFQPRASLRFIAFAAEELMLFGDSGCEYYAEQAFNTGMNIKIMINADMISHTAKPLANSRVRINYYTGHTNLLTLAKDVTNQFTSITAINGSLNQYSDSYPFYQKGYPAVYFEEDDFSPYYHTVNDVITNYSMPYCTEVVKAAGATLLKKLTLDHPVPVELISFNALQVNDKVELNWTTASEVNNFGFEIQKKLEGYNWTTIGFKEGYGTTHEKQFYSFSDFNIYKNEILFYRLKQIDFDGSFEYSKEIEVEIGIPYKYALYKNYPNPFNPTTKLRFTISDLRFVELKVYDVLGKKVATLVNEIKEPGEYEVEWNASKLSSGVYFYRLKAGSFIQTNKMILNK